MAVREFVIEDYYIKRMGEEFPKSLTLKYELVTNDPDRITFLGNGDVALVELKRPGKEPREGQYRALRRYSRLGVFTGWANSKEMVENLIIEIKNWRKK